MNVQGFISAMSAYDSWKATHSNASATQLNEFFKIAQSDSFIDWIYNNPNGTLEQYVNLLYQQQAYYNSSQCQLDILENQVGNQRETIESLQDEVNDLKSELSYLQSENDNLSHYNIVWFSTTAILLVLTGVLFVAIYKRTNIIQNSIRKFRKKYSWTLQVIYDLVKRLNKNDTEPRNKIR